MARWTAGAICAAAVLSLTLASAQTAPPRARGSEGRAADQSPKASDAAKARAETMITGCVVRDAASGGRATIASNGMSYVLAGPRQSNLDRYLGRRVEVTGTLESKSASARATAGSAVPLATDKGTTADLSRRLQVKTIRIVSPNCL